MEEDRIVPIMKPGIQTCEVVTKYRPISLLNVGRNILERALINRINQYMYSTDFLNNNEYGFFRQMSTTDTIVFLKDLVQEGFSKREIIGIVSLYVERAFNSAWAPSVLKNLQKSGCPRNLYNLTKNYFSKRRANMVTNNIKLERAVSKGCPQGSCIGPRMWNIFYNSLLKIKFTSSKK